MASSTRTSRSSRSFGLTAAVSALALLSPFVCAQSNIGVPPGDQILFGMWYNPSQPYSDSPTMINQRLGFNVPVFQLAQEIPLPAFNYVTGAGGYAPEGAVELSGTDAAVFLTVYPGGGFANVAEADFTALGAQILSYQSTYNRTVYLRYAPEMQGLWNEYGNQPAAFVASWQQMYGLVKAIAPETIMVWAPNTAQGYPYGQALNGGGNTAADQTLLDTNNDGTLSATDDGYSPYWPGTDYVDWVGISLYYKGQDQAQVINTEQTPGYCAQAINGVNPATGVTMPENWYQDYCVRYNKPCMYAESGAAYHVADTTGATRSEVLQAWIVDCITNISLYNEFPQLRMVIQFEYEKVENANDNTQDLRDFRMTNDTSARNRLIDDLNAAGDRFSWANPRATPTSIASPQAPPYQTDGSTVVQAITQTLRARPTTFPSLFGLTSAGSQLAEMVELGVVVAAGVGGALAVMRMM